MSLEIEQQQRAQHPRLAHGDGQLDGARVLIDPVWGERASPFSLVGPKRSGKGTIARVLTATVAQTAPVYLTGFVTSQGLFLAQLCAAAFVVSLPVLVAGFAAQDKLVQGLSLGSVK